MTKIGILYFAALLAAVCAIVPAQEVTVTTVLREGLDGYAGTEDATLYAESDNSFGGAPYLFTGMTGAANPRRSLLKFDLSPIPGGATITSASLALTVTDKMQGFAEPHSLHRVTASWGEGDNTEATDGGQGLLPEEGDATWNYRFYDTSAWTVSGGDFVTTPSATFELEAPTTTAIVESAGMTADLAAWHANPSENFGWIIIGNESGIQNAARLFSSESVFENTRPQLTVQYTVPAGPVDAIIGRTEYDEAFDVNSDGVLDAADVVF